MQVADYFADLKSQITNHPLVSSWRFQEEVRTRAIGWFKAEVAFQNGVILNLREFVIVQKNRVRKLSYSYHCRKERLVFRYDNAPHHAYLPRAPHHKHLGNGRIIASKEPTLQQILDEIGRLER